MISPVSASFEADMVDASDRHTAWTPAAPHGVVSSFGLIAAMPAMDSGWAMPNRSTSLKAISATWLE
jgi:hypothetical protein